MSSYTPNSTSSQKAQAQERALEAVRLKGEGKTNSEIGQILGVHPTTVSRYICEARKKALVPPIEGGHELTEQCYQLRLQGWSYPRIAAHVGKNVGDVHRRVKSRLTHVLKDLIESASEQVQVQVERLDKIISRCEEILDTPTEEKIIKGAHGSEKLVYFGPSYRDRLAAMDRIMAAEERRAKLLGLDWGARETTDDSSWNVEVKIGYASKEDEQGAGDE